MALKMRAIPVQLAARAVERPATVRASAARTLVTNARPRALHPRLRPVTSFPFTIPPIVSSVRALHNSPPSRKRAHNNEEVPDGPPTTDFNRMDMLGETPVPSTSVDICMSEGFKLNNGILTTDGSGILLVGGEAFSWRPWGPGNKLVNAKGQWEVPNEAFNLLSLLWPRPDLLILGLGPEIRPIASQMRKHLSSLGLRVEVLDTRNAASQFNMLATERGVNDVAAAMIPIGWKEGLGAR